MYVFQEQLPLLFLVQVRRIKYGHTSVLTIWDRLYAMVHLACTYLYMLYIFHKQICWTWEGKVLKLLLGNDPFCHDMETLGENVKPDDDALKQTLKAIIYVICIMQHNASALTWYAVQTRYITELPHVTIAPLYTSGECTNNVLSGTNAQKV